MRQIAGAMGLTFEFRPSPAIFAGKIDKLGLDIRSFREPLTRAVKQVVIPSIRENFNASGRPDPWPELSQATWDSRAARGWSGGDILLLSGLLVRTATQFNIWTITEQSATVRDFPQKAWYGKVHQAGFGGVSGPKTVRKIIKGKGGIIKWSGGRDTEASQGYVNIPARPFMLLQEEDKDKIQKIFEDWLEERIERTWGVL